MAIKLPDIAFTDLACILDNVESLTRVMRLGESLSGADSNDDIVANYAAKLGIENETTRRIVLGLLSLHGIRNQLGLTVGELLTEVSRTIERDAAPEWKARYLKKWKDSGEMIGQVLNPDSALALYQKADSLAYRYENIYSSAKIITDLRPVFNDRGDQIQQAVVMHLLMVDYQDGSGRMKQFALALDLKDIKDLRATCQRAERKALATKEAVSKLPWPTIIKGEKSHVP